jgi:redox-sensitive bicupin YhaK (pirin superfamily)
LSNLAPSTTAESFVCDPSPGATIEALPGNLVDLGGIAIRRLLPRSKRRLVGAWCFFDSFGPLRFQQGQGMDVAPHPHIGIQTVTWLLAGEVMHKDSLGSEGLARPGVLNLMTAGRGIAHAEETPPQNSGHLRGAQLWVALPEASRNLEPAFEQQARLPVLSLAGGQATLILGELGGLRSPARVFSPIVGAELAVALEQQIVVPLDREFEHAFVPLEGECQLEGQPLAIDTLYYLGTGRRELRLEAGAVAPRALLLGGAPFGETVLMWWNFVARTTEEIIEARTDWMTGRRFGEVRAYAGERLAAPPFVARPVPRP